MSRRARAGLLAAGAGLCSLPLLGVASPAVAGGVGSCDTTDDNTVSQASKAVSQPLDLLHIAQAQQLAGGGAPGGAGVTVAVVDSGIKPAGQIDVVASYSVHGGSAVHTVFYHGTAVAGLIAGQPRAGGLLTGVAPGAHIVDVQTYGWPKGSIGNPAQASTEQLVTGLTWLAAHARSLTVRVAVVPQAVPPTPALAAAVKAVQAQGVLVVAPSGNRPADASPGYLSEFGKQTLPPDADGFSQISPADLPGVLVAGTTAAGPGLGVNEGSIPNHAVDVVVPTAKGISVALNGGNCLLGTPETSWSAAEVGGIAALLFQRFPDETPAQIAARIVDTASGTTPDGTGATARSESSLYLGAGVVQPVDALTRPLTEGRDGTFTSLQAQRDRTPPARAPETPTDLLHRSRHLALWGALLGGAVVMAAAILRPLFTRRRAGGA